MKIKKRAALRYDKLLIEGRLFTLDELKNKTQSTSHVELTSSSEDVSTSKETVTEKKRQGRRHRRNKKKCTALLNWLHGQGKELRRRQVALRLLLQGTNLYTKERKYTQAPKAVDVLGGELGIL